MGTFSANQIRDRALVPGGDLSWVEFLKSEAVAKKVADKVWAHLSGNGYRNRKREHLVFVKPSARWKGTWKVEVFLPGVSFSDSVPGGREMNKAERDDALAALRVSYGSDDLVTSWTY